MPKYIHIGQKLPKITQNTQNPSIISPLGTLWYGSLPKPWFGSCQTRVWRLPNPSLAAAKPEFGSRQTRVWRLPNPSLAAAKPEFGDCQTRVWQLPNPSLAAARPGLLPNRINFIRIYKDLN